MIRAKKLVNMIQQWQDFAALRRKKISSPRHNSGDGLDSCCAVSSVDKGHFAIYTADGRRFVVPLAYLNNPVFRQLLEISEEEYGLPRDALLYCLVIQSSWTMPFASSGKVELEICMELWLSRLLEAAARHHVCMKGR